MVKSYITFRYIALFATSCLLCGCLGGTVAQQIVSAIATRVVDKAVSNAIDAKEKRDSEALRNAPPDPYTVAFVNSAFEEVKPIAEPLPEQIEETETPIQIVQSSQLVRVELFNLLIGEDKAAVYENARLMGATSLPQKREWPSWNVATGVVEKDKKIITFLIPPEFGKLPSGAVAMVELASPGELNVARYKVNDDKDAFKALANR
jgi:hypothetical protein